MISDTMAEKPKKPQKLKARLPRGLADRGPADIAATHAMIDKIRKVYELYGFEPVETPAIEFTDALGKFLPDQDRPNEGVFSFQDDDGGWLSLRYDLTAPLARYVAENFETLAKPYRSYRYGWVFRNEKPGPGRFRQFMQFDADTVGSVSPAADAEMCMMAADAMEALGFARGQYVVKVNNRKVLDGVMEAIGVTDEKQKLTVLRAIDKFDRLGEEGVLLLLTTGRKDESGDFTKGAELPIHAANIVVQFILSGMARPALPDSDTSLDSVRKWNVGARMPIVYSHSAFLDSLKRAVDWNATVQDRISVLDAIGRLTARAGHNDGRIIIDPSVVRGLEYYTGPVFEVELLIETKDDKGRPVRFGSVGGGGRYDGLVSRFRGEAVPATGFSIGVSRLRAALDLIEKDSRPASFGPVVVTVFDKERLADYQGFVKRLRDDGIRAELYLGNPKNFGNQMKYADKRNSPCVVIQGGDEKNAAEGPLVIVKDLIHGAQLARGETERAAHLERQGEAQVNVPEADLVEAVREVLARHKVAWE